jgi:predicted glycosyltransferase involved in capsule biosynthesis
VLASINGYNEHFSGYGYDDADLRIRLQSVHVGKLLPIKYDYSVMHIPHENSLRIVHYTDSQYNVSNNKETAKNMGIAPNRVRSWTIKNTSNPNYFLAHDPTL